MLVVLSIVIFVLVIFIVSYHIFVSYLRWQKINQQLRALRNHKHKRAVKAPAAAPPPPPPAAAVPPSDKRIPASNTMPPPNQPADMSPPSSTIGGGNAEPTVETFMSNVCPPPPGRSPRRSPGRASAPGGAPAPTTPPGGADGTPPSVVIQGPTPTLAPSPAPTPTVNAPAPLPGGTPGSTPGGGSCNLARVGGGSNNCCDTENHGIQNNNNIEIVITDKRTSDEDAITVLGKGGAMAGTCDEARRLFIEMYPEVASLQTDPWSYYVEHGAAHNMRWPGPECPSLNWSFYPVCSVPFDARRVGTYRDDIGRWIGTDPNHGNRTCKYPVGSTDEGMLDYSYASASYHDHDGEYDTYASSAIDVDVALPKTLYDTPYIVYEPRERTVPAAYTMVS